MPNETDYNPTGALIGAGLGAIQSVIGLVNSGKARKEAAKLERNRPKYEVSDLAQEDLDLTESELASGMSSRAESAYNTALDRQFAGSMDAILRGGGSVNNISELFDSSEAGRQKLAILQDNLRLNQIQNLMKARGNMITQQDKAFEFNKARPWFDKAQAAGQARQGAQKQIWSGLDTFGGAAMQIAEGYNDADKFKDDSVTTTFSGMPNYQTQSADVQVPTTNGQQPWNQRQVNPTAEYQQWYEGLSPEDQGMYMDNYSDRKTWY